MTPAEAREYLAAAARTETGRAALRDLGFGAVIAAPERGDDEGTVVVAGRLRAELRRRYGI